MRDEEIFTNRIRSSYCDACQNSSHTLFDCPFIQFRPNRNLILSKYNYSIPIMARKKILRHKQRHKFKSLKDNQEIRSGLRDIRILLASQQEDLGSFLDVLANDEIIDDKTFFLRTPPLQVKDCPSKMC